MEEVPPDLSEDEIVEAYKDLFFEQLANTASPKQKEACAKYLEEFHSNDPRLMLIAAVLREKKIPKPEIPWAKRALVVHYDWLRKQGLSSTDALVQTGAKFHVSEKTVDAAIRLLRKHTGTKRGDPFPFGQLHSLDKGVQS